MLLLLTSVFMGCQSASGQGSLEESSTKSQNAVIEDLTKTNTQSSIETQIEDTTQLELATQEETGIQTEAL